MSVRFEVAAEDDLRNVVAQCHARGHPDPAGFARMLRLRIGALAAFPHSGHPVPDSDARKWTLHGTPYLVLYIDRAPDIDVLRVLDVKDIEPSRTLAP